MNPSRARRVIWWGVAASVLLHLSLLSGAWIWPQVKIAAEEPAPITARMVNVSPPSGKEAALPPKRPVRVTQASTPPKSTTRPQKPEHEQGPAPEPEPVPEQANAVVPPVSDEPVSLPVEDVTAAEPAPPDATPPPVPQSPALNPLPRRLTLEFRARYGVASGQQTLLWVSDGERYTITSILSPQGMASLFYSGQLVQTSRGRVVATGLQPEEFWDQRGDKRSQSRFDYTTHTVLNESSKGARTYPLPAGLQDAQSLLFQLALTAPPPAESDNPVFNGKKVRSYRYRVVGEENLQTPLGALRTLHMARLTDADTERFEIWLAIDRYYLPVKLSSEISGLDAELLVQRISED